MTDRAHWAKMLPIIQAFVDGKEVEVINGVSNWETTRTPYFYESLQYRVKPELIVKEYNVLIDADNHIWFSTVDKQKHLRLTFDPDTKELLSAEVIK